jgi:Carboxypeptidase regulatory-like domain
MKWHPESSPRFLFELGPVLHLACVRKQVGVLLSILVALACAVSVQARAPQDQKEPELRTVHGSVVDKDENPVPSSVVYLKNVKTQGVKTYIADDAGDYRFSGLDPNVDYEIHAEHNDLTSSLRTISSYDSRRDINLVLKLAHKKNEHQ